ncbi:SDR family oxidoreductase [Microaerobacter geothermalis]|uniref:SDR family oxidoreductase n=1 Tax=Microaerobacter geothermalis TaxID=674972 RepID=UPI001F42EF5B|nr:SDR family oxidoreductase [Microaerobacter geothermalis]MCF6094293.1 SDR family oxidoreductase [Microaerobacter geothermalis]
MNKRCEDIPLLEREKYHEKYQKRIFVLSGTLTENLFGWSHDLYDELDHTIVIIHSAANVKHYGEYQDFYDINVKGTKRLLDFAKTLASPQGQ